MDAWGEIVEYLQRALRVKPTKPRIDFRRGSSAFEVVLVCDARSTRMNLQFNPEKQELQLTRTDARLDFKIAAGMVGGMTPARFCERFMISYMLADR